MSNTLLQPGGNDGVIYEDAGTLTSVVTPVDTTERAHNLETVDFVLTQLQDTLAETRHILTDRPVLALSYLLHSLEPIARMLGAMDEECGVLVNIPIDGMVKRSVGDYWRDVVTFCIKELFADPSKFQSLLDSVKSHFSVADIRDRVREGVRQVEQNPLVATPPLAI